MAFTSNAWRIYATLPESWNLPGTRRMHPARILRENEYSRKFQECFAGVFREHKFWAVINSQVEGLGEIWEWWIDIYTGERWDLFWKSAKKVLKAYISVSLLLLWKYTQFFCYLYNFKTEDGKKKEVKNWGIWVTHEYFTSLKIYE